MITAIRIEHPYDGCGIFNSIKAPIWNPWFDSEYPSPMDDKKLGNIGNNELCAFLSVEQFISLIPKNELLKFTYIGFRVYELELKDCRISEYQILFEEKMFVRKQI